MPRSSKKMNICMFAKGLPIHYTGGMENHVQNLINGLAAKGHEVTVITTKHPSGLKVEKRPKLKIFYVGDRSLKYTKAFFRESAKVFLRLSKQEEFDIIHSQSYSGYGYCKFYKKLFKYIPFVVTCHGTIKNEIKTQLNTKSIMGFAIASYMYFKSFVNPIDREVLRKADRVIAVSYKLAKDINCQYKIPMKKIRVIPCGVDVNKFQPMNVDCFKEELGLSDKKIIQAVGRILREKGFHILLKAFPEILKEHNDVKLVIVGSGPYLQSLKRLSVKLNISNNVIFTGQVPQQKLPKYYNLADVFVFPTLRVEAIGLVLLEAMACGKPVVASKIGGVLSVIEHGKDGILVEPGDPDGLKNAILKLLDDENLRKKLGSVARKKIVKSFSVNYMVNRTINLYQELVEEFKNVTTLNF